MSHRRMLVLAAAMGALVACRTSGEAKSGAQASDDRAGAGTPQAQAQANEKGEGDRQPMSERDRAEAEAAQKAPSVRPSEGVGGHDPHPLPQGERGSASYGEQPAESAGQAGRVPDTQERATQAERSTTAGTSGATAGTATGTSDANAGAATGRTGMASQDELTGRVALLDAGEREIAIDSGSATTQVKVADDAKITVDGKSGSFSEIRQGAEVRARLDRSGDSPKAIEIQVMTSQKKSQ
jgi:hypothetical protein